MFILQRTEKALKLYPKDEVEEFIKRLKSFKRFYEYLIQVSCFEDIEVHKKYIFISYLLDMISIDKGGDGFDLKGKIKASNFVQEEGETYIAEKIPSKPVVKLSTAQSFNLSEDKKERLSRIISEINSRYGKDYDEDVATKAAFQIKDIMMKSEGLKVSAKNNTEEDFLFSYYSNVEDALVKGIDQNQDFFTLLLNNPDIQKEVLGIFANDIYKSLRKAQI